MVTLPPCSCYPTDRSLGLSRFDCPQHGHAAEIRIRESLAQERRHAREWRAFLLILACVETTGAVALLLTAHVFPFLVLVLAASLTVAAHDRFAAQADLIDRAHALLDRAT